MPVSFSSPPRNLFLLGSSGADAVTNFFKEIDRSVSSEDVYVPDEIRYNDQQDRYILAGTAETVSTSKEVGWIESRDYDPDLDNDPSVPTSTLDYSIHIESSLASTDTTLRAMHFENPVGLTVVGSTGTSVSGGSSVPWIAQYNTQGVFQWQSTSNTANVEYTGVCRGDAGYFVCGNTSATSSLSSAAAEAFIEYYDIYGNPGLGKSVFKVGRDVVLEKISANSKNEVIAVGYLEDDSADKGYIVKMNGNTGEIIWDRTLERDICGSGGTFPGQSDDCAPADVRCTACYVDGNDQIYVVGSIDGSNSVDNGVGEFLVKYSPEGNMLWQRENKTKEWDDVAAPPYVVPFDVQSDTDTQQTVVLSVDKPGGIAGNNADVLLSKYSRDGSLVFRRKISKSTNNLGAASLDTDASFYYVLFRDQQINKIAGEPDRYFFGKVSTSGNGLGDFSYDDSSGTDVDYTIVSNAENRIGRLSDGSVRNDTSDLVTYPFSANNIVFDDLATPVSNKKRQLDTDDGFGYSGSPTIRSVDRHYLDLEFETYDITTEGGGDPVGQAEYTTPGTYSWTAPAGVTSVCVVCVGAGGSGGAYGAGGGSLVYKNNITTVPGTAYTVEVGATNTAVNSPGNPGTNLTNTWAGNSSVLGTEAYGGAGGNVALGSRQGDGYGLNYDGGGKGGLRSTDFYQSGVGYKAGSGGGAGGYSGDGGNGGYGITVAGSGSGGGGGGGSTSSSGQSFGGGGVGIYGEGASGAGGIAVYNGGTGVGGGGSGGTDSTVRIYGTTGNESSGAGSYGGGGGGGNDRPTAVHGGAVRLIWGTGRAFPSTNTADQTPSGGSTTTTYLKDLTGNGNDFTMDGPTLVTSTVEEVVPKRWQFDGVDDIVTGPKCNTIFTGTTGSGPSEGYSIEMWINFDSTSTRAVIFSGYKIGDPNRWDFEVQNGNLRGGFHDAGYLVGATQLSGIPWYHVVLVHRMESNMLELYVDGKYDGGIATNVGQEFGSDIEFCIGDRHEDASVGLFHGSITKFRIYKKTLTEQQIYQNYNANKIKYFKGKPEIGLNIGPRIIYSPGPFLAYWDFKNKSCIDDAHNLFTHSFTPGFDWNGSGPAFSNLTKNTTEVRAPDGSYTATKWEITGNDPYFYHREDLIAGKTYTMSAWVKAGTGMAGQVLQQRMGGAPYSTNANSTIPADGSWKRLSFTKTIGGSDEIDVNVGFEPQYQDSPGVPSVGDVIYIWGPQLEEGVTFSEIKQRRLITTYGTPVDRTNFDVNDQIVAKSLVSTNVINIANETGFYSMKLLNGATHHSDGYVIFDNTNSNYLEVGGIELTNTDGWTIETWIKVTDPTNDNASNAWNYFWRDADTSVSPAFESGMYSNGTTFSFKDNDQSDTLVSMTMTPGTWHWIAFGVTNSGKTKMMYIDGNGTFNSVTSTNNVSGSSCQINRFFQHPNGGQGLAAHCGEIRIYNRELLTPEGTLNLNATRKKYGV